MAEQFSTVSLDEEIENDCHQTDGQYEASQPELERKLKRIIRPGTHISVPHDILYDQDLQQPCERWGMTPTQASLIVLS